MSKDGLEVRFGDFIEGHDDLRAQGRHFKLTSIFATFMEITAVVRLLRGALYTGYSNGSRNWPARMDWGNITGWI